MQVSIDAVPPDAQPVAGSIAGNVYRFAVTDGNGGSFTLAADAQPSLTLRGPDNVTDAVVGHLTTSGWQALATEHGGGLGLFTVVLCVPSVCYLLGLTWGGSTCRLRVEFGPDLKLRRAVTDLHY